MPNLKVQSRQTSWLPSTAKRHRRKSYISQEDEVRLCFSAIWIGLVWGEASNILIFMCAPFKNKTEEGSFLITLLFLSGHSLPALPHTHCGSSRNVSAIFLQLRILELCEATPVCFGAVGWSQPKCFYPRNLEHATGLESRSSVAGQKGCQPLETGPFSVYLIRCLNPVDFVFTTYLFLVILRSL